MRKSDQILDWIVVAFVASGVASFIALLGAALWILFFGDDGNF